MNDNELNKMADLLFSKLYTISSEKKSMEEKLESIKGVLLKTHQEGKQIGRNQILNHFKIEIDNLKKD